MIKKADLPNSWLPYLGEEFDKPYMQELAAFLEDEKEAEKVIYPAQENIFNAFKHTGFDKVKVVIIGQDPYHGPDQAHGLSFSVPDGIKLPPSLKNIYKEIEQDLGISMSTGGNLTSWADQGVLLLNAVLTVEQGQAASHQKKGWEAFTDKVIEVLSRECEGLVFVLWGGYAHKKGKVIDADKHKVLKGVHPSPLSVYRGFYGCAHFSIINAYLQQQGKEKINWLV